MATIKSNIITESLSGMIGKNLVFRFTNGKTIVSVKPDFSRVTWSEKQADHRERFRFAAAKARVLAADPDIRKKYAKKLKPGCTVYNVILKEMMKTARTSLTDSF